MENAAQSVVKHALALLEAEGLGGAVVVCCGGGNNGGDGYAVARLLKQKGLAVTVLRVGSPAGADVLANMAEWSAMGGAVLEGGKAPDASAEAVLTEAVLIVDALFGTGLSRPVQGAAAALIAGINAAPAPIKIAVDVPSGIHADTGAICGVAVRCTHTVTFQVAKVGCFQHPGAACAGRVLVEDIALPLRWEPGEASTYLLNRSFIRELLPQRPPEGHKGIFGHLLGVCGSAGMGGAALLVGLAGLRVGAGLVTLGVPRCLRDRFFGAGPRIDDPCL